MKPRTTSLNFILLLFINGNLFAQTSIFKGQIVENNGSSPIIGANVFLLNTDKVSTTDELGNFRFTDLAPATYKVIVTYLGFENYEQEIAVSENKEIKIVLKVAPINLLEVTVNSGKLITQSQSITGIDKLLRPINSAQDLLQLVPGLFIAQHAGGGKAEQILLRGFDSDHGTDFNISVDGMPVNMVSHAHGQGYADFHFVIPETINKLKVYKGPYTARFGDFSTSGTGEFSTKNSLEQNEVKAEIGMFQNFRVLGMFKLLDKKHLLTKGKENAYIAGEYVFSNSYFNQKQKFHRFNIFGKYTAMLNDRNYFSFSASTFFADWNASGQVPQRAIDAGLIDRFGSIDPTEGGTTARTNVNATLTTTTKNNFVFKNQLFYVRYYFNLFSNFTFFLNDSIRGDEIEQTDNRNIFGYSGTVQKDFNIKNSVLHATIGVGSRNDLTNISLKHAEKRVTLDTIVSGKVYQQNTNAYVDLTFDINKHFSINTGTRVDFFQFNFKENRYDSLSGNKLKFRASPKLSFFYTVNDKLQFFLKSGIGFHSNDARSVVINKVNNVLPKAYGAEIGTEFKLFNRVLVNAAFWSLYLESELVYIGDEGTVETNTPTKRFGVDLSVRYQIIKNLFADVDFNYNYGRLVGVPKGENFIPLAPRITSTGGITYKHDKGFNASIRYRYIDSRPANETNSVTAKGYFLLDLVAAYKIKNFEFGVNAENLLNTKWNQAQFDTESRLPGEANPVSELHFTPGTPFYLKGTFAYRF